MKERGRLSWVMVLVACVPVMTEVITENTSDPLPSLFIRQEATLRKLDVLIVKVSKVDELELKLDLLTNLLKGQEEKNSQLEAKLRSIETKQEALLEATEDMLGGVYDIVDLKGREIKAKIDNRIKEVEHSLEVKLGAANTSIQSVSENIKSLNLSVHMIGASVEERLDDVSSDRPGDCGTLTTNTTEATKQMMHDYALNLTLVTEVVLNDMKSYFESVVEEVVANSSQPECDSQVVLDCQRSLSRLEELVAPSTNATKHLIAAVFNRIRVSNLAMDKRLGALLHTSSIRQRVLQDRLLAAITSVDTLVRTQTQDVYRKVESRLGGLEDSLAASAKRHAKELAMLVLEAANYTLNDMSSSTAAQIDLLLHAQANNTAVLNNGLDHLQELHNLTQTRLSAADLCVVSAHKATQNGTTILYTDPSFTLLNETIATMADQVIDHMTHISDQVAGLRIYYSTSLHMHTQQISSEVEAVQSGVRRAVQDTLNKSTRTLEKLRRSSLGYLDAAVTSVSSAAVASAQSTADQLTEALQDVTDQLQQRLSKLEGAVKLVGSGCPARYTLLGGTCLLPLHDVSASWEESRDLCRDAGGHLATIPNNKILSHLQAQSAAPLPSYWLGGRKVAGAWEWITGTPVEVQLSEYNRVEVEDEESDLTSPQCLMSQGAGLAMVAAPCDTPLHALCEYRHALYHSYVSNDSKGTLLDLDIHPLSINEEQPYEEYR
ncbi:uncharacterized protein LOC121877795 [Homarus americanus]|uniref:CD209 antigen-like 2 n=1 Tax=Homarus americanus TaxID=6706 RepID=A0A8J5MPU9_HOMAM|nr:uncharacterized protein LOC121877795 [Homarus americanus]KAG7159260.1 CD209 antigen-like 2 [Homarus americanus]